MKLVVVFAQREEGYPGQYAPEVFAAVTEFENDDNPDYIQEQLEKAQATPDLVAARIVEVDLGKGAEDRIKDLLIGYAVVEGTVLG